jgi:hypothetical protein
MRMHTIVGARVYYFIQSNTHPRDFSEGAQICNSPLAVACRELIGDCTTFLAACLSFGAMLPDVAPDGESDGHGTTWLQPASRCGTQVCTGHADLLISHAADEHLQKQSVPSSKKGVTAAA